MTESWSQYRHVEKNYCLLACDMGYSCKNFPAFQKTHCPQSSTKTSVNFYLTMWHHIPEDSILQDLITQ